MLKIIGDLAGILSIIATCSAGLIAILAILRKELRDTIRENIKDMGFGLPATKAAILIWMRVFVTLFGNKYFSWKMFVIMPLYTFLISIIVFFTWFVHTNFHNIASYGFKVPISLMATQAFKDYYLRSGLAASIVIDFISILMTKKVILLGLKHGFTSIRFTFLFVTGIILIYFIFAFIVYGFRLYDMVIFYAEHVPNDPMPVVPLSLFPAGIDTWVTLSNQVTIIYVTSKGAFSTYFMPEPVMFYCAVIGQASLIFITISILMVKALSTIKQNFVTGIEVITLTACMLGLIMGFMFLFLWIQSIFS